MARGWRIRAATLAVLVAAGLAAGVLATGAPKRHSPAQSPHQQLSRMLDRLLAHPGAATSPGRRRPAIVLGPQQAIKGRDCFITAATGVTSVHAGPGFACDRAKAKAKYIAAAAGAASVVETAGTLAPSAQNAAALVATSGTR